MPLALAAAIAAAGCGKTDAYRQRYFELQEQTRRKIADLDAARRADRGRYEQRLIGYEAELRRLRAELAAARQFHSPRGLHGAPSPAPAASHARELSSSAQALAALAAPTDPAAAEEETVASFLETFAQEYEELIDEGRRAQFRSDFAAYVACLREDVTAIPASQRKESVLQNLRTRLESATSERERALFQGRIDAIENASAEDLPGVLDYYGRLDSIQALNRLLDEYEIPRDELIAAGIEPPPRSSWQPETREIAGNLRAFTEGYEALVPEGMREQFRREAEACVAALTARPTDAQVIEQRDAMLRELRERAATSEGERQQRIARRIAQLESEPLDSVRRRMQTEKLDEIAALADKYSIPRQELRESGVWYQRRRRR